MSSSFNIYAQIRLLISLLFLPFQFFILPHFILHEEWRSATCFRIMFAIGICESYQLLVMGICPYSKYIGFYAGWVENIMGAFNESTLDILFFLNLLLAINRLCVVVKMNVLKKFSTKESRKEKMLYNILFSLTAIIFVLITTLFLTPKCGLYLDEEYTIWNYNLNLTWTYNVRYVEEYGYMALPTICFLAYCTIVAIMKMTTVKMLANNESVSLQKSHEFRILLQSLIQFVVFITPIVYGFSGWRISNTALDNYGVSSVCTVFYCGLNPVLYLLLLPKLRCQVFSALRIGRGTAITTTTVVLNMNTIRKVEPAKTVFKMQTVG